MRRALARAADKATALSVSVLGISEEDLDAEESLIERAGELGRVGYAMDYRQD
jgi:hypothetical protein